MTFQSDLLERRELLSAITLPGGRTAEVVPLAKTHKEVVKGTITGKIGITPSDSSMGSITFSGSGTLGPLGEFTLDGLSGFSESRRHAVKYTNGSAVFIDPSSNQITSSFTGSGKQTGTENFSFKFKGKINDGTGPYSGAAGKITATGSSSGESFTMKVTVTLTQA
jgi:hypothetical protein